MVRRMGTYVRYTAMALVLSATLANAFPAESTGVEPESSAEVEILKSKEVPLIEKEAHASGTSQKRLRALNDYTNDDDAVVQKIQKDDDHGTRMLGLVQGVLQNILQPQPIVDTISEDEKYGNNGDTLGVVGRGIVNGSEALSNFVNLAIEYPTNLFKSLAHRATEALNHLGSKLVGL